MINASFLFIQYAMRSQAELRGFDPNEAVLEIHPRAGESTLRTEDILKVMKADFKSHLLCNFHTKIKIILHSLKKPMTINYQ